MGLVRGSLAVRSMVNGTDFSHLKLGNGYRLAQTFVVRWTQDTRMPIWRSAVLWALFTIANDGKSQERAGHFKSAVE